MRVVNAKRNDCNNVTDKMKYLNVIYADNIPLAIALWFLVAILIVFFQFSHLIEL